VHINFPVGLHEGRPYLRFAFAKLPANERREEKRRATLDMLYPLSLAAGVFPIVTLGGQ